MSRGLGRQQRVARAQAFAAALSLAGLGLRALKPIGPDFTRPWAVASSPEALIELTRRRNLLNAMSNRIKQLARSARAAQDAQIPADFAGPSNGSTLV